MINQWEEKKKQEQAAAILVLGGNKGVMMGRRRGCQLEARSPSLAQTLWLQKFITYIYRHLKQCALIGEGQTHMHIHTKMQTLTDEEECEEGKPSLWRGNQSGQQLGSSVAKFRSSGNFEVRFTALEMLHWAQSEQLHNLNTEKPLRTN